MKGKIKIVKKRFSKSYIHFAFPEKSGSFEVEQIIFFFSFSCEKNAFLYYTFPVKCIIFCRLQFFKLPKIFHLYLCEFGNIGFEKCVKIFTLFLMYIYIKHSKTWIWITLIYEDLYNMVMRLQLLILFNYLAILSK